MGPPRFWAPPGLGTVRFGDPQCFGTAPSSWGPPRLRDLQGFGTTGLENPPNLGPSPVPAPKPRPCPAGGFAWARGVPGAGGVSARSVPLAGAGSVPGQPARGRPPPWGHGGCPRMGGGGSAQPSPSLAFVPQPLVNPGCPDITGGLRAPAAMPLSPPSGLDPPAVPWPCRVLFLTASRRGWPVIYLSPKYNPGVGSSASPGTSASPASPTSWPFAGSNR